MRRLCLCALLLGSPLPARAEGDLYLLGVALNQDPDKKAGQTIDSWNYCAENVERLFREQISGRSSGHLSLFWRRLREIPGSVDRRARP